MRIAKVLVLVLALSLLVPIQQALSEPESYDYVKVNSLTVQVELFENTTANVVIKGTLSVDKNYTKDVTSIVFPIVPVGRFIILKHIGVEKYFNISSNVELEKIEYEQFAEALLVKFKQPIKPGESASFRFFFSLKPDTVLTLDRRSNRYIFAYRFYTPNATVVANATAMKVFLPMGAAVSKAKGINTLLQSDPLSRRLVAVWEPFGDPIGDGWDFQLEFSIIGSSLSTNNLTVPEPTTKTNEGNSFPLIELTAIIVVSNLITGASVYLVTKRSISPTINPKWSEEGESISEDDILKAYDLLEKLDKDEEAIIRVIADKGGRIEQKELPDLTGFSKSKVSRVLKRLDSIGAVRRISSGKTKIVELNPAILTVLDRK